MNNLDELGILIRAASAGITTWMHVGQMAARHGVAADQVEALLIALCIAEPQRAMVMAQLPAPLTLRQIARDARRLCLTLDAFRALCAENGIVPDDALEEVWNG